MTKLAQDDSWPDELRQILLSAAAFLLVILGTILAARALDTTTGAETASIAPAAQDTAPVSIDGRYLFSGTIVWDRGIEEGATDQYGALDPAQPFSQLDTYEPEKYNAWIADLECPIAAEDVPPEIGYSTFEFNCRQEFLPEAARYFDVFNLANNHSGNSGREKLEETHEVLGYQNVQFFGDPDPSIRNSTCEVVGLPVTENYTDGTEREQFLPVAFCAWHYFFRTPEPGEIEVIKQYADVMPVFAFVHMGAEYQAQSTSIQKQVARRLIDNGADFVIGNNPHWVQEAEEYKGKLIVYSTGNFIFDQRRNSEVSRNVNIDVSVNAPYDLDLEQWLEFGQSCMTYQDACLERATQLGLKRIDLSYAFAPVAGDMSGVASRRADQTIQTAVEERLNWEAVSSSLSY
ncbi:MAG: CapA family protein [Patescibacteria group bacterium]